MVNNRVVVDMHELHRVSKT